MLGNTLSLKYSDFTMKQDFQKYTTKLGGNVETMKILKVYFTYVNFTHYDFCQVIKSKRHTINQ